MQFEATVNIKQDRQVAQPAIQTERVCALLDELKVLLKGEQSVVEHVDVPSSVYEDARAFLEKVGV